MSPKNKLMFHWAFVSAMFVACLASLLSLTPQIQALSSLLAAFTALSVTGWIHARKKN